jgi:hypothetical protein
MKIFRLVVILSVAGLILATPIFWRAKSPLSRALIMGCPVLAAETDLPFSGVSCGLGNKWEVNEGCWRGVYTRRGNSNVFDAEWKLLDGRSFTAEVTLDIQGNQVSGRRRRATLGGDCELINGTLGADGLTVSGVWDCNHPEGRASSCFFAKIACDGRSSTSENNTNPRSCGVGRVWNDRESGIDMIWTRRGNSNVFDVTATINGSPFTAEQTIEIRGSKVFINRYKAGDGNTCTFVGTIQADGIMAEGTYDCTKYKPSSGWRATINCN